MYDFIKIGLKNGERDSTLECKALLGRNQNNNNNDVLTVSDEELQYIIENYENLDHNKVICINFRMMVKITIKLRRTK